MANPFSDLFVEPKSPSQINPWTLKINEQLENVFLFTLRPKSTSKQLVFMEDGDGEYLNLENIETVLFERLLLPNPEEFVTNIGKQTPLPEITEKLAVHFLYQSFHRNSGRSTNTNDVLLSECSLKINELIFRNLSTAIKQPDLFSDQQLPEQLLDIVKKLHLEGNELEDVFSGFLASLVKAMMSDASEAEENYQLLEAFLQPTFMHCLKRVKAGTLVSLDKWIFPFLAIFVSDKTNPRLAELLLNFSTPKPGRQPSIEGVKYSESLLGGLLSLSIMPKNATGPYEYYENPQNLSSIQMLTSSLWNYMKTHLDQLHLLFKGFLLCGGDVRDKALTWIGDCLHTNIARGQIWNTHTMSPLQNLTTAPDSAMIGLAAVLLRLCQPLVKPQLKVMSVDPTYASVKDTRKYEVGVHMKDLEKETCLLPTSEDEQLVTADKYNFITECFFLTHKAIDLSYRVAIEKLVRMNRELNRLQVAYQDTVQQGGQDLASNILQMLTSQTQQFLCLQNLILEPTNDQFLLQFYEATAIWLTELATNPKDSDEQGKEKGFAPLTIGKFELPATNKISNLLKSVPEFILENIVGYLQFSRQTATPSIQSMINYEAQTSLFTMILLFMGSADRVRNPHLRARLADGLESLLPKEGASASLGMSLFTSHPYRLQVVPNLLRVFVEIEMTGQAVQFEQKFNYRRPMYNIMNFIWDIEEQRKCFVQLEIEAIQNMEAVNPPLFLRFINLLINDAIFLLDESLNNLQQIRQLQAAQDNGEWNALPANERQQNLANLQHLGMLAKFDNILGRDTIKILRLLTSKTKNIFCHSTMVDRMASMLNYFLIHLVGPKKSEYKVKDKKEYEFDPAKSVIEICQIYINLNECDEFCLAVSQDGRSYSAQLFEFALQVLARIGGGALMTDLKEFADKVQRLEKQQQEDDEILTDIPDDFVDPILGILMSDPIILPTSHTTLDRSTLLRHFLSDQTDPFNRSPLTMDQVKPDIELKAKIDEWIREKREAHKNKLELP